MLYLSSLWNLFLGNSPDWYKKTILLFLIINPFLLYFFGSFITSWCILIQFIFTLTMALKCYPLQAGGLLAIQSLILKLTSAETVKTEILLNFSVILLLIFMIAGIYFMKDFLLFIFKKLLVKVHSKLFLSILFLFIAAALSAFLDALTVIAVIISISVGLYQIINEAKKNNSISEEDTEQFYSFLRGLLMHSAIGTALGGSMTIVGEPQNILIANVIGWNFGEFALQMSPITIPLLITGILVCIVLEKIKLLDYGAKLPQSIYIHIKQSYQPFRSLKTEDQIKLIIQGCVACILIISLSLHIAEVGLIGLMIIILLTSFTGINHESQLGKAFEESLPFVALLVVFFAIVAMIHDQHLFKPVSDYILSLSDKKQILALFTSNGLLSAISDNVFVATIFIKEIHNAFTLNIINQETFHSLGRVINIGTNIPSIATPNGQAAFLFLLTSQIAPKIKLSYLRMTQLSFPYFVVLSITSGLLCLYL